LGFRDMQKIALENALKSVQVAHSGDRPKAHGTRIGENFGERVFGVPWGRIKWHMGDDQQVALSMPNYHRRRGASF